MLIRRCTVFSLCGKLVEQLPVCGSFFQREEKNMSEALRKELVLHKEATRGTQPPLKETTRRDYRKDPVFHKETAKKSQSNFKATKKQKNTSPPKVATS